MTKYYTLNQAVDKAYKERKMFKREPVQNCTQGLYNALRLFFGYAKKEYYFEKDKYKDNTDKNYKPKGGYI
jgi:hypothetical protein